MHAKKLHYLVKNLRGAFLGPKVFAQMMLTLEAPITTAADDIHKYFFIVFQRK